GAEVAVFGFVPETEAGSERIARAQLVVDASRGIVTNALVGKSDTVVGRRVIHAGTVLKDGNGNLPLIHVVEIAPFVAYEERGLLADGAADAGVVLVAVIVRNVG